MTRWSGSPSRQSARNGPGHSRKPRQPSASGPPLQKAIEFVKDQWPDGNIPRTAKVRRRMAESEVWKCIAAKHGISTKKIPDWHTVNRALDREV